MAHLAAGARLALVVEVKRAPASARQRGPALDVVADQIVHLARRRRPATCRPAAGRRSRECAARTARSTAPSIVQWPLLWTRGAISLTTGPSAQAKNSTVITPTWPSVAAIALGNVPGLRRLAGRPARRRARSSGAGCRLHGCCAADRSSAWRHRPRAPRSPKIRPRTRLALGDRRLAADRFPRRLPPRRHRGPRPGPCRHSRSGGS